MPGSSRGLGVKGCSSGEKKGPSVYLTVRHSKETRSDSIRKNLQEREEGREGKDALIFPYRECPKGGPKVHNHLLQILNSNFTSIRKEEKPFRSLSIKWWGRGGSMGRRTSS